MSKKIKEKHSKKAQRDWRILLILLPLTVFHLNLIAFHSYTKALTVQEYLLVVYNLKQLVHQLRQLYLLELIWNHPEALKWRKENKQKLFSSKFKGKLAFFQRINIAFVFYCVFMRLIFIMLMIWTVVNCKNVEESLW